MASKNQNFDELTPQQVAGLSLMNEQLDEVGRHITAINRDLEASLAGPLGNPGDRLWDYNLDVRISFALREDDPAWRDDSDNQVAEAGDFSLDCQWPDGYDQSFPMPHGGVMHCLRLYGGYEHGHVDYRDISRIGTVHVDVMVTYQYAYDLSAGRWIKSRKWEREESSNSQKTTYVEGGV